MRGLAGIGLPSSDRGIDVKWVDLQSTAYAPDSLGGDQRRAAAEKAIEHDLAAGGAVQECIGNQPHRFDGRVQGQEIAFLARTREGAGAGMAPQIAAIAPMFAALDIAAMRR